jgi:nitrate reductase gamma subunit
MTEIELLSWARGPGLQIATIIFVAGVVIRILEILLLGRKANLAEAKGGEMSSGVKTMITRTVPDKTTFRRSSVTIVSGYAFHIGLFVVCFLSAPHILFLKDVIGFGWPAAPTAVIDAFAVITIIAMLVTLVNRLTNKVMRYLTTFEDLLTWFITFLPVVTGYIAFHRIGMTAPTLLAVHILSVELLLVVFPFTKLMHAFTLFIARWYNGAISGYRGVAS